MVILERAVKNSIQLYPFSPAQNYYVFCFMFDKNKLISIGKNDETRQCAGIYNLAVRFNVEKFKKYAYRHAEIDCIRRVWGKRYITGREKMVVVRIKRDGSLGLAKPCNNCQQILSAMNFNKIWYSTDNGDFEQYES